MWKCRWAESKFSGYLPIFKQLRFVFIHFCFPRHVLTRTHRRDKQPRQAADCCAERSTEKLSDSWIKISIKRLCSAAYYPHHWASCFIICACLTTRDLCATSKTLKSKVWVCFVDILLYWVLNFNLCYDDPIHCTATSVCKCVCLCFLCTRLRVGTHVCLCSGIPRS